MAPYIIWQNVKPIVGIIATIFFLSAAYRINAPQGGIVNNRITNGFVTPI